MDGKLLNGYLISVYILLSCRIFFLSEYPDFTVDVRSPKEAGFVYQGSGPNLEMGLQIRINQSLSKPFVRAFSQDLELTLGKADMKHHQANSSSFEISFLRQTLNTISPRHSWLEVSSIDGIFTIELAAPSQGEKKGRVLVRKLSSEVEEQRPGQLEHEVGLQSEVSMPELSSEILRKAVLLDHHPEFLPEYDEMGPNSNGFVKFIVEASGGTLDLPWNAYYSKEVKPYSDNCDEPGHDRKLFAGINQLR